MKAWSGRHVTECIALTLRHKGSTCHLCGLPGANSADHNPPRVQLIRSGELDPDQLCYLFPAHRLCNVRRRDRAITPDLRAELRDKRLTDLGEAVASSSLSPRFARRAADFFECEPHVERAAAGYIPGPSTENGSVSR